MNDPYKNLDRALNILYVALLVLTFAVGVLAGVVLRAVA